MGTFGEKLQREREMRGITLEEIAEATKIGTRSLRALEEQDFDKLPGGIFNKGFVRAYSKYLGIDEEQAVADYVQAVSEAQESGKITRLELDGTLTEEEDNKGEPIRVPWTLLASVVLLFAIGYAARAYYAKHGWPELKHRSVATKQSSTQPQPAAPQSATSAKSGVPTAPGSGHPKENPQPELAAAALDRTGQEPAGGEPASGFVLRVHANELSWVSIEADGKMIASENMAANADRMVLASKQVVIKTGNAGGIQLTKNGKPLPPIGPKHEVRTVTVTTAGLETVQ